MPDARFKILDSHLVEGRDRWKFLESYVALDGSQTVAAEFILYCVRELVVLKSAIPHRHAHLRARTAI